jgi:IS30 family transposase
MELSNFIVVPQETAMSYTHLTLSEREIISKMAYAGHGPRSIGRTIGRSPGTISRELSRNRTEAGYGSHTAQEESELRRQQRPIARKLDHPLLESEVKKKLSLSWSPDEVAGRLKIDYPDDPKMHISHQTIYRWLYSDPTRYEAFRPHLRHGHYRPRGRKPHITIRNRVSHKKRPAVVEERSRIGDWEGDTIVGHGHKGYVATFVDRRSGFLVAARMKDKRAATLNRAALRAFAPISPGAILTLTVDNGTEFAMHEMLSKKLDIDIYFADPYSSWQRGTNENTNGLLRQFVPKRMNILELSPTALAFYVEIINNRPRKRLLYLIPAEVFLSIHTGALQL